MQVVDAHSQGTTIWRVDLECAQSEGVRACSPNLAVRVRLAPALGVVEGELRTSITGEEAGGT
eukprot:960572-Prymnesium_polylepis.2